MYKSIIITTLMLLGLAIISPVHAARFRFSPANLSVTAQCPVSIDVFADATGESSNSADLIVFYDSNDVTILDSDSNLTGTQVNTGVAYSAYASNQVSPAIGRIRMTAFSVGNNLTENRLFATIPFQSKPGVTSTNFTIQFDGVGETMDSNIASSVNSLDLLDGVTNATINFTAGSCVTDQTAPTIVFEAPTPGETGVTLDSNISIRLTDDISGIDLDTLQIIINGVIYTSTSPEVTISGSPLNYLVVINPSTNLNSNGSSTIFVTVDDLDANTGTGTNVINIPTGTAGPTPGCNCDNPIVDIIDSSVKIDTGNPVVDEVINEVLDNLGVTGLGATIAGFALLLSVLGSILPLIALLNAPGALFSLLSFFIGKKHTRPWGIILDATNHQPVAFATCRLYIAETTNLITQTVSDTEGRYGFVMSAGSYRLEIKHNDYATYTENFKIAEGENGYLKDVLLVQKSMQQDTANASLWGERWKEFWLGVTKFWENLRPFLFALGFTLSVIAILVQPTLLNYFVFALYAISMTLLVISKLSKAPKFSSVVDSNTNLRVPFAVIKFYKTSTFELVDTQVSNANGLFDFFGEEGEYAILVAVRGYKFPSQRQTDLERVENKYMGMLKANLTNGRNRITLYLDPIGADTPITNTLEPASQTIASPTDTTILPEAGGNLPTPFN